MKPQTKVMWSHDPLTCAWMHKLSQHSRCYSPGVSFRTQIQGLIILWGSLESCPGSTHYIFCCDDHEAAVEIKHSHYKVICQECVSCLYLIGQYSSSSDDIPAEVETGSDVSLEPSACVNYDPTLWLTGLSAFLVYEDCGKLPEICPLSIII